MNNYCTLFDSHYLDKGLVLYWSLEKQTTDYCLYIFCFDDKSYDVLTAMNLNHVVLVREKDIETPELLIAKGNRTRAEYCWTCTSIIIKYVLDNFKVDSCTYIDSDLYFYKDPHLLLDELSSNEHIIITPHRLKNEGKDKRTKERYGTYCVEFNYFDQSDESRKALNWWIENCLNWCYCKVENGKYGDQKYLDLFQTMFAGVHILQNLGGGVAPWNIKQYEIMEAKGDEIILKEKSSEKAFNLVFYHFQSIRFLSESKVNVNSGTDNKCIIESLYYPYLREIMTAREKLKTYGVFFSFPIVHSGSLIKKCYQKYIKPRIVHNVNDIINLPDIYANNT